jgi:cysteine-rich repeat protein
MRALLLILLSGCSLVIDLPELPLCGDGIVDPGETCDDGNLESGDGCNPGCVAPQERVYNSTIQRGQSCPRIAFYAGGASLLVFDDDSASPPDVDTSGAVRARHFDADGAPTGADFVVHQSVAAEQEEGNAAADEIAIVVWEDKSGGTADVRARAFSQIGGALGPEAGLGEIEMGEQRYPAIAAGSSGFLAVWLDETKGEIRGRRIDRSGTVSGPELTIGDADGRPDVAWGADRFLVVWSVTSTETDMDVLARFVGWDGAMSAPFTVNAIVRSGQTDPALAFDPVTERFLVAWTDASGESDTDDTGIRGRAVEANGDLVGASDFQLNEVTLDAQETPSVAAADGIFFVAWAGIDVEGPTRSLGIRGRRVSSDGTPLDADVVINTITVGDQKDPDVAAGPGGFHVLWEDESGLPPDGSNDAVRGLILPANPPRP